MVKQISLKEIIESERKQEFLTAIANFKCQDDDVEKFLKEKAVDFDRRNRSRTYLLVDIQHSVQANEIIILGYYTLTMKSLLFGIGVSKSAVKKIDGFRPDVTAAEAVLIGQLGKNSNYKDKIDGKSIIDMALSAVYAVQNIIGGRIVFLECQNNEKVVNFYENNGFMFLQNNFKNDYLQMIRYL